MPRWLYLLLIMAVVAPIVQLVGGTQQALLVFICSAIALIPLAVLIGRATEDLEYYVGPIAGGLLNATFGNAPEFIIDRLYSDSIERDEGRLACALVPHIL